MTNEAQQLSIVDKILVRGVCQETKRAISEPDEAVSKLLEGESVFVIPRIVDRVTKTINMVLWVDSHE